MRWGGRPWAPAAVLDVPPGPHGPRGHRDEAVPPPRQLARGDVFIEGAPDELYDGLYAADAEEPEANGSRHYANGAGAHLFCTRLGEWCLKEVERRFRSAGERTECAEGCWCCACRSLSPAHQ